MKVHHRQIQSMGTRLDLVLAGVDPELCEAVTREVKVEFDRIEEMLSIHRPGSTLSLINETAHAGIIELEPELAAIFSELMVFHRLSGGYFDVSMKPVSDFHREQGADMATLPEKLMAIVGMDKVELLPEGIRFRRKGVSLDLGGYGKGYAVKRILPILETYGIVHALISFGESLIYGWGTHPHGDSWRISVPVREGEEAVEFELKNEALSTSGNSLNNQKKIATSGHIVNPVTCQMVRRNGLVSVKSDDPLTAEVYSTALFSVGRNQFHQVLKQAPKLEFNWIIPDE